MISCTLPFPEQRPTECKLSQGWNMLQPMVDGSLKHLALEQHLCWG